MYWIYLALFILIVFIPDIIENNFYFLSEEKAEEFFIFLLGALGFSIFIFREKQLYSSFREKKKMQREINETSKGLIYSYSHMGEINRWLEIIKDSSLQVLDACYNRKKRRKALNKVSESIKVMLKTKRLAIYFINQKKKVFLEKSGKKNNKFEKLVEEEIFRKKSFRKIIQKRGCAIIKSSKRGRENALLIVFNLKHNRLPESIDIIQVLSSQLLFLYIAKNRDKLKRQRIA